MTTRVDEYQVTGRGKLLVTTTVEFVPDVIEPPPPVPSVRKAFNNYRSHFHPLGSLTDTSTAWTDHSLFRAPGGFSAVQFAYFNHTASDRVITDHMAAAGPTGVVNPSGWMAGQHGLVVPAGLATDPTRHPGFVVSPQIDLASVAASDGGPPWFMARASMIGCAWHMTPGVNNGAGWDSAAWDAEWPGYPMQSWVKWWGNFATPSTAGDASGWSARPGRQSVCSPVFIHNSAHAAVIHFGDSTAGQDLNNPPHTNYMGFGWRAVRALAAQGVRLSFGSFAQGGSEWPAIRAQVAKAVTAGFAPGAIGLLQVWTSNSALSATEQYAQATAAAAEFEAAGGKMIMVGPMCSTTGSQARLDARALMRGGSRPYLDTGAVIGTTADPSMFAPGMCGDPESYAVHGSQQAAIALGAALVPVIQQVLG